MRLTPILELSPDQSRLLEQIVGPGVAPPPPFLMWAHNVEVARWAEGLGGYCRNESRLNRRQLLLTMLLPGRTFRAASMWNAHYNEALEHGFTLDDLEQLARGDAPDFADGSEAALYAFAQESLIDNVVSDEVYADALEHFGEAGLLDIIGCLGSFTMSCLALNAFRVPINEELGWPFPKDTHRGEPARAAVDR